MERRKTVLKMPIKNPCRTAAVVLTLHASQYTSTCCIIIIIIIILNDAEIRVTLSHLKCFKGTLQSYIISVSLPEKRWQTVLSSISGGKQAVTGFPWPKLEGNSRHATQQPETHDHQWWLDVSVVWRVSTSKQTGDDDVLVHQPSTEVSQQGTVAQCQWRQRCVRTHKRNCILSGTLNQCSSRRSGMMCSEQEFWVKARVMAVLFIV